MEFEKLINIIPEESRNEFFKPIAKSLGEAVTIVINYLKIYLYPLEEKIQKHTEKYKMKEVQKIEKIDSLELEEECKEKKLKILDENSEKKKIRDQIPIEQSIDECIKKGIPRHAIKFILADIYQVSPGYIESFWED
ncbi:MAG: hypothetical protein ACRCU6_06850 [Fusobacteriaceae bacterium]|uniref:hypothetical protein n=1 Tax=Cetobacterium sp. TaxID=2071632 RepID=UPI003EE4370A